MVLNDATDAVVTLRREHIWKSLNHLFHQSSALARTLSCQFTKSAIGILIQQTNTTEHVFSQICQFSETVSLGKGGICIRIILFLVEVIGAWTTVMVDIKRLLTLGCWSVFRHLPYWTGIEHSRRTVNIGLQFLGNF